MACLSKRNFLERDRELNKEWDKIATDLEEK
jgi:hypothetical protein